MRDRSRLLKDAEPGTRGPVLHWMRREFRVESNPGLLLARELAEENGVGLGVVVCLPEAHELPSLRQLRFLLDGLRPLQARLRALNIPFFLRVGDPAAQVADLARSARISALTTDFDPLRPAGRHLRTLLETVNAPVWESDGRNTVPCWLVSDKKEYMARTIRPKIHRLLPEFMASLPALRAAPAPWPAQAGTAPAGEADWSAAEAHAAKAYPAAPVDWVTSAEQTGEPQGGQRLDAFVRGGLRGYAENRNDPVKDASSRLSPWLHFGFLSALDAALAAAKSSAPQEDKDAFLEELIVRRELADNFCLHEPRYDALDACAAWAQATLDKHRGDKRSYVYDFNTLEKGETHQPLWNAAQRQLVDEGFLHGYMRMYWAKKILEWSPTPEEALDAVVRLNDCWSLDGMDSNGYAGAAWSVCGVHDRGWAERPVFGSIRYMNSNGARRKFDAAEYVRRYAGVEQARAFASRK
ncbi:deoxyribodipyrimidine photo-lyase [Paucidesulfovibrio longus]|uniref:deoxyribodipyrimidine photo-lyase n=1 Tax=Paucidesulfovibrio longus TaxID=889 RepID=UPI0003B4E056|nr:deoxyribodipyrimidine photo-lyase [Paucidesulfovibrio longus]